MSRTHGTIRTSGSTQCGGMACAVSLQPAEIRPLYTPPLPAPATRTRQCPSFHSPRCLSFFGSTETVKPDQSQVYRSWLQLAVASGLYVVFIGTAITRRPLVSRSTRVRTMSCLPDAPSCSGYACPASCSFPPTQPLSYSRLRMTSELSSLSTPAGTLRRPPRRNG